MGWEGDGLGPAPICGGRCGVCSRGPGPAPDLARGLPPACPSQILPRRMFFQGPAEQMAFGFWPGSLMGRDPTSQPAWEWPVSSGHSDLARARLCVFSAPPSHGIPGLPVPWVILGVREAACKA